jgi:hypothetical protein
VKYTADPLEEPEPGTDLSPQIVVEVLDVEARPVPIVAAGDKIIGFQAGDFAGRLKMRLTSDDPDIETKLAALRKAVRDLREEVEADLTPSLNGEELESAEAEAELRTRFEFISLLSYACLAVELETGRA